jgi:hypothetical protein
MWPQFAAFAMMRPFAVGLARAASLSDASRLLDMASGAFSPYPVSRMPIWEADPVGVAG